MHAPAQIAFRRFTRDDVPQMAAWLRDPDVSRWWPTPTPETVDDEYRPYLEGEDPLELFVVVVDGHDAGVIQRFRFSDEREWHDTLVAGGVDAGLLERAIGIDYLIGEPGDRERGVGTQMLVEFTADTFAAHPDVPRIVVAVLQENRRSWRALERAGYVRVWAGELDSPDPSDDGPEYVLVSERTERTERA